MDANSSPMSFAPSDQLKMKSKTWSFEISKISDNLWTNQQVQVGGALIPYHTILTYPKWIKIRENAAKELSPCRETKRTSSSWHIQFCVKDQQHKLDLHSPNAKKNYLFWQLHKMFKNPERCCLLPITVKILEHSILKL